MEKLIPKSAERIKKQIQFWFLRYHGKDVEEFDGTELFTLFDLLNEETHQLLGKQFELRENELPVLCLKIEDDGFIINTTERFIRLNSAEFDSINYKDFEWHTGFKFLLSKDTSREKIINSKVAGRLLDFGLRRRDGEIIYWKVPTGSPGFGFWNVTKKCELIGRRYVITK